MSNKEIERLSRQNRNRNQSKKESALILSSIHVQGRQPWFENYKYGVKSIKGAGE